jgi:Spy/CpxP family protein refolding chaperone
MNGPESRPPEEAPRPRGGIPPRIAATLVLLATFALGAAAGVLADRKLGRQGWERRAEGRGKVPSWLNRPESEHRKYWGRIHDQLGLTPEQRAAVDTLLSRRARQLEAARHQMEPEMLRIMQTTRAQIDSILTPDQRSRLEEIRKERRERRERNHDR